jgi:hypothetical protein
VTYTEMRRVDIAETTVGALGHESVAAANGLVAEFSLPDGSIQAGPSMLLIKLSDDAQQRVGLGSVLQAGGYTWTVVSVTLGDEGDGGVALEAEVAKDRTPAARESLDFLFRSACQLCGGRTGWDGSISTTTGRVVVGMRCIRCPNTESMTGGRVERMFFESPPGFKPGRVG